MPDIYRRSSTDRIGWVDENGRIYRTGSTDPVGTVHADGRIYRRDTDPVGTIGGDGGVYRQTDRIGFVDNAGNVYRTGGTDPIGNVTDSSKLVYKGGAALLLLW